VKRENIRDTGGSQNCSVITHTLGLVGHRRWWLGGGWVQFPVNRACHVGHTWYAIQYWVHGVQPATGPETEKVCGVWTMGWGVGGGGAIDSDSQCQPMPV
jgi:hypothetical protein